jgi:catechol 2,3-dioxygenase-like lactoylglutathione lyase family enzyme
MTTMETTGMAAGPQTGSAGPLVHPTGLDHANLHVRNVEESVRFYTDVLGVQRVDVLDRDDAGRPTFVELRIGQQTVFLMQRPDYQPPADRRARGLNHICLLIDPTDPERLQEALRARGVTIRGTRRGGRGEGQRTFSVYVEDPDGHGIELEQVVAHSSEAPR